MPPIRLIGLLSTCNLQMCFQAEALKNALLTTEQRENIKETHRNWEHEMADFLRDLAALTSIALFIASFSIIVLGM